MELSNEQIRDVSVKVVEEFINHKVPLVDGITKCASEMELNPEQVKRVVEASNTVAYLKLQKEAQDKTFEFPVASYEQVMHKLCVPEKQDGTLTEEAFQESQIKEAEEHSFDMSLQEKQVIIRQEYFKNKAQLEKIAFDKAAVTMRIGDLAMDMKKDPLVLEKLAEVCDEDTYKVLSQLFDQRPLTTYIFKEAELIQAEELVGLFKQAKELIAEEEQRVAFEKRALFGAMGSAIIKTPLVAGAAAFGTVKALGKSKVADPLSLGASALYEHKPSSNVWDNLQGTQKRY